MSTLFNTTPLTSVVFNGVTMEIVRHNGDTVFDDNAVFLAPSYNMAQPLVSLGGYLYLENTEVGAPLYNGKLCLASGLPYLPSSAQYPINYTLSLADGKYIDTERIISPTEEIVITLVYNVSIGTSYKIYRLHYKGNGKADIYKGENVGGIKTAVTKTLSDIDYTPPLDSWKIYRNPPSVINTESIIYNMDSFITV